MKVHEFTLYTLVNITNTQKRTDVTTKNFNTLINGISLSVQPMYDSDPTSKVEDLKKHQFGSKFTGRKKVWTFKFKVEGDKVINVDLAYRAISNTPVIGKKIDMLNTTDKIIKNTYIKQTLVI